MPIPDLEIVCVDCGGTCYPLGWHPEDGEVEDGTVIPYRCKDCLDRWDIVIGDWEDDANSDRPSFGTTAFGSSNFDASSFRRPDPERREP